MSVQDNGRTDGKKVSRRTFLSSVGCIAGAYHAAPLLSFSKAFGATKRPNIIFIITDDQTRDQFNFLPEGRVNGKKRNLTPTIDRLSTEGVIFTQQYAVSAVCTPSRFCCLTGQYASRAQNEHFRSKITKSGQTVVEWNTTILPTTESLPKILKSAGYVTGAVGKNHVIQTPRFRNLSMHDDPTDPKVMEKLKGNYDQVIKAYKSCGFDYAASIYNQNLSANAPHALAHHNLEWIVKGAFDFIDQNKDQPFFLYFATTLPHSPARGRAWKGDPLATPLGFLEKPIDDVMPPRSTLLPRIKEAGRDESKADMLWLDDAVGALVKKLEQHNLDDNTVIFYFNDHGVEAGKGTAYQGGVRSVSFAWAKKGIAGGRIVTVPVSNIDFTPTILDLCGISPGSDFHDGKSMKPLLRGSDEDIHRSLYFEIGYTRAVLKDGWKYIALRPSKEMMNLNYEQRKKLLDEYNERCRKTGKRPSTANPDDPFGHLGAVPGGSDIDNRAMQEHEKHYFDADQLYNLKDDPNEQNNLALDERYQVKLNEMKAELKWHLMKVPGTFAEFKG